MKMNKRMNISLLILSVALTIIGIATNTVHIITIGMFRIVGLMLAFLVILYLVLIMCELYFSNKFYNDLLDTLQHIKNTKKARYKAYFSYTGEELKKMLEWYDSLLESYYSDYDLFVNFLKDKRKFLSKSTYEHVLELASNEIRGTGRV